MIRFLDQPFRDSKFSRRITMFILVIVALSLETPFRIFSLGLQGKLWTFNGLTITYGLVGFLLLIWIMWLIRPGNAFRW